MFIYREEEYKPTRREPRHRRDHHRQAAQRADRHREARVHQGIHALREPASGAAGPPRTRARVFFACQACGFESSKWLGRCPDCGEWNSFAEERQEAPRPRARAAPTRRWPASRARPRPYDVIDGARGAARASGIGEFDRVLGGGIVPGLDGADRRRAGHRQEHAAAAGRAPARPPGRRRPLRLGRGVRAPDQAARRAARHRGRRALPDGRDLARADPRGGRERSSRRRWSWTRCRPSTRRKFPSAPGSISQVREVATQLLFLAKGRGITTFLIGHVTKDGSLAGPKSLEHIVDTVLYFEGEKRQHHRIVRAVKNRFGAVSRAGRLRDDGRRAAAGRQPVRAVPGRAAGRARRARRWWRPRGHAADAGRGAGARLADLVRHAAAHGASGSTRTAPRCCWPCSRSASGSSSWATTSS